MTLHTLRPLRPGTISTLNGERVFILGIAVEDSNRGPREVIDYIDGNGNGRWAYLDRSEDELRARAERLEGKPFPAVAAAHEHFGSFADGAK